MLSVITLSVIMLNVVIISVIMLSVIMLKVKAPMFLSSKSLARQQKMGPRLCREYHFPECCFPLKRCHDTQHNSIQHNDNQYNNIKTRHSLSIMALGTRYCYADCSK
jgi:hypothetical protein